jgi:drug/metabolite transporter (DMT)-like permease
MVLSRNQALVLMLVVTVLWSIAGVISRQLESARSFEVTFWRSAFTAISLLMIFPLVQGADAFARMPWKSKSLWVSGLCWSVMFTAFMVALTLTSVANVLIVMSLGPLFTALLAWLLLGHRMAWFTWAAIGYMYAPQLASGASLLGSAVALCVPVAGAVQWTLAQHLQSKAPEAQVDLVPAVLLGALLSAAFTLPLALPFSATLTDVAWLASLGLFQLAIPCALSVLCARVLAGPEVSLLALLEIVFGIALVWVIVGESPGERALLGGGVVLGALALNAVLMARSAVLR